MVNFHTPCFIFGPSSQLDTCNIRLCAKNDSNRRFLIHFGSLHKCNFSNFSSLLAQCLPGSLEKLDHFLPQTPIIAIGYTLLYTNGFHFLRVTTSPRYEFQFILYSLLLLSSYTETLFKCNFSKHEFQFTSFPFYFSVLPQNHCTNVTSPSISKIRLFFFFYILRLQ